MSQTPKPIVLIILDGWGYREDPRNNAIAAARKPTWDKLWSQYPHTLIQASEHAVGLPPNQMGNSEVGHLNIGAGRVVYQDYSRINRDIENGAFFENGVLTDAVDLALRHDKAIHILGLLSPGGVHSHDDQIHAMVELAARRGVKKLYLHAFLDGRDTPPQSALASIDALNSKCAALGCGRIVSLIGRYYAMDRDKRWPRTQIAFELITQGKAEYYSASAAEGIKLAYARGETDEFIKATAIAPSAGAQSDAPTAGGAAPAVTRVEDGDVVVFMNFRSDRARQLTRAFIESGFKEFPRVRVPRLGRFVTLTQYHAEFDIPVAFAPERLSNVLSAYLAAHGRRQLRVAETEKYAHVTFFFNGGVEAPYDGEDRVLVPSPSDVATYDLKPEMSAPQVADVIVDAIQKRRDDVIVTNFANADMVGHTGKFDAVVKAIETIDSCLGRILTAVLEAGGEMLITSDHGNAEQLFDFESGQPHTAHTTNPVPFIYVGRPADPATTGALQDIAPTLLYLMGLPVPAEMTGRSLVSLRGDNRGAAASVQKSAKSAISGPG
jgi:2,3-bisphosphoglycerate-independent phosphoglycerate mutase